MDEQPGDEAVLGEPPASSEAAWARFDAAWYLRTYPQVRGMLFDLEDASVLAYYREHGQKQRHAPNPFFDEPYFLHADAVAAEKIRNGTAASGFEVYCADRGRHRKPHWLFDEAYYRHLHPDLTEASLSASSLVNGYDHFLRHGSRERRSGSPFFDPAVYQANLDPADIERAENVGCFAAYIAALHDRDAAERTTSHYFDPPWYLRQYPAIEELIARRRTLSALHHYLTNDAPTQFDPLPEFSEKFYLQLYPDIADAVRAGNFHNGYEHFLYHGVFEQRQPSASIDLKYYVDTYPSVREDLKRGAARDAFAHYLSIGRAQGLHPMRPPDETVTEGQANTLFLMRARTLAPILARRPLDFSHGDKPVLSAIMAVHDGFASTLQTLASLRANFIGAIELILVDLGSTDETLRIERCLRGATMLRFDANIGALRGRNAGIQGALADTLLFLGNDVEIAPGVVGAAMDRLASDAEIGAVGGKVVGANGRLQEAGCIVWRDGSVQAYLRDGLAAMPEANFVRDVDFCSSRFLMARCGLLRTLDGFDGNFAPDTCEDADLGLRIAAGGHRVVYDPSVVVYRVAAHAAASYADMTAAHGLFLRRHAEALGAHHAADPAAEVFARTATAKSKGQRRRILFIGQTVPLRMLGGDAVRSGDLIATMASIGADVTAFPILPHDFDLAAVLADIADTVEVMHDRTIDDLAEFLHRRAGYYDIVWVAGAATLDEIRPVLASAFAATDNPPRVILGIARVAALQAIGQAALSDQGAETDADVDDAMQAEFASASFCERIVTSGEHEAAWLRGMGHVASVVGPVREPTPTPRRFQDRNGLLFVGAVEADGTPNHDSLCWFVEAVLPLVEKALGWETRLTIAGRCDDKTLLDRFRGHPRVTLRGALIDLTGLYDAHRVFVAPTRFGAGLPYKAYEAASCGLPIVASDLASRQMGWRDGQELLAAPVTDPARYAERVVGLYRDAALWQSLRDAALARLTTDNSRDRAAVALRALLG